MSSKAQLTDYNKRLRSELSRKEAIINNMLISLSQDKTTINSLNKRVAESNIEIRKLNSALKKSKRWYQIIIRI